MALVKCKECDAQISTKAETCPQCGAKRKKGIGCGGLVLACFLFFIIISVISTSFRSSSSDSPAPTEAPPPAAPKPPTPKTPAIVTPQSVAVPPAPVVTPKPKFDILSVPPSEVPQTTRVTKDIDFAMPGESGNVTAPAGAEVTIISLKGDQLIIAFASLKKIIPYSITTIEEDITRNRELAEKALLELHAQQEKERVEKEKEEKIAAGRKKLREPLIEKQFSAWDGSHLGLTRYIKKNMKDPDSYGHMETRFADKGDYILVITKFRGRNGFGGMTITTIAAECDIDGHVLKIISQE